MRLHAKPCGLLNVAGYYDGFLDFLRHAVAQDFLAPAHFELLHTARDPDELLDKLLAGQGTGGVRSDLT